MKSYYKAEEFKEHEAIESNVNLNFTNYFDGTQGSKPNEDPLKLNEMITAKPTNPVKNMKWGQK